MSREGLGAEHPLNDRAQLVFMLVFLAVWAVDTFFLHYALSYTGFLALFATVPAGVALCVVGIYFIRKSEVVVFNNSEGKVIDTGVYGRVRHPMYFGGLLLLLGLAVATLSILAFAVWVVLFVFMDRMASYEEKDLARLLGQKYVEYQKRVHKWLPT
jgi:protein-S-isoprenylcysteine O-methyltransferase Ste14